MIVCRSASEIERLRAANQFVASVLAELEAAGAHVYIPRKDQDYAIVAGLRMLTQRHLVEEKDGLYTERPEERPALAY